MSPLSVEAIPGGTVSFCLSVVWGLLVEIDRI